MKITYLDHSGFAVEQEDALLVFDECNPQPVPGKDGLSAGVATEAEVRAHGRSVLFLSHSHSDHYCKEVLELPFAQVVVSQDFPARVRGLRAREGERLEACGMTVRVFGSTDMGVSFLVDVGDRRVFHAGDLNLWHWENESTKEEIEEATAWFERILRELAPYAGTVDAAFFPLDPRMGENTGAGACRFNEVMRPKVLIPMHFQGDSALVERFAAQHDNVLAMTRRGQSARIETPSRR